MVSRFRESPPAADGELALVRPLYRLRFLQSRRPDFWSTAVAEDVKFGYECPLGTGHRDAEEADRQGGNGSHDRLNEGIAGTGVKRTGVKTMWSIRWL